MKETSIKILNRPIKRKTILTTHIFIQMILNLLAFKALSKHEYNIIEYLSVFLASIYIFIVYLTLLLNNKNKRMIYYYSLLTIILSFFLIIDLAYLKDTDIIHAQIMILFLMFDITLKVLTQNINKGSFYRYMVIVLWAIGIIFWVFKKELYMLVYQITFLMTGIYPLIFAVQNYRKIKSYGNHLIPKLSLFVIINIIYIMWMLFIPKSNSGSHNYDLYIYFNLMELFLSYLVLSALGFWEIVKDKKYRINKYMIIKSIFVVGYLYCIKDNKENLILITFSIFSFFMVLKQLQLLDHYIELENNKVDEGQKETLFPGTFKKALEISISDFRKEEIFKEQVADFLHDEILQDAIYIKKELQDNYKISRNDKILEIADGMINRTRGQISLYKPHINYEIGLEENYYNLIQSLKRRFANDKILLDFVCDNKLFLSSPYDLVIYRMIHELVTNIFKHSKGDFSIIELKSEDKTIFLTVISHGDYLSQKDIRNTDSRGIRIIEREVDRFGGRLDISSSIDPDILDNKDMLDDSVVNIKIKIPIKGEMTYEYFINR